MAAATAERDGAATCVGVRWVLDPEDAAAGGGGAQRAACLEPARRSRSDQPRADHAAVRGRRRRVRLRRGRAQPLSLDRRFTVEGRAGAGSGLGCPLPTKVRHCQPV